MQADRFKRLQALFDAALEQDATMRSEFVNRACGDDHVLAEEILVLVDYEMKSRASETARPFALAAAAFEAVETNDLIGQIIGHFKILAPIAAGGMGRVFKAERCDGEIGQVVALKLIRRELLDATLLKRFSIERRILASLNHPGIVHIIDAGADENDVPFVAMEYVDGLPLLDYCTQRMLSVGERLKLFQQVLDAVSHAHRQLVVHRDLKPDNVLVTVDGRTKLLDFGIAKTLLDDAQQTVTTQRFFTPTFASPELLLGGNVAVACDVYALGAVLYTLLTGVPPFDLSASRAAEAERMILKTPPPPMRASAEKRGAAALRYQGVLDPLRWAAQLDGDLDNIVQKALLKEPSARYISVEQFSDDIARYLGQRPVLASGTGKLYRARKYCERNALAVAGSTIAIVMALIGIGYIVKQNDKIRSERDRAQVTLEILKNGIQTNDADNPHSKTYNQSRIMLASAAREVIALEKSQPDLFRDIAYKIGEIQINIGAYKEALSLIRRANRINTDPADHGLLLEMRALIMAREYREARILIDANRERFRDNPEFRQKEADVLIVEGRYLEAAKICERFIADSAVVRSPKLLERFHMSLKEAYRSSGQLGKAMKVMDKIVLDRRRRYGEDQKLTFAAKMWRIELLAEMQDYASAERELLSIAPMIETYNDYAMEDLTVFHDVFGQVMFGLGRPDEAITHFRKGLLAAEKGNGQNVAASHFNLGIAIAMSEQDHREAYRHFWKAIEDTEKTLGLSWASVGEMRWQVADNYLSDSDPDSARKTLTPPHALEYFKAMQQIDQAEYLRVLYQAFGPQNCEVGWEKRAQIQSESMRVARTLVCRYDPEGTRRAAE
jgi:eukaryotic-like serine/threonine-protein kinase